MQKDYYKLRAKVKLTSHLSYRSRCGRDVVAGLNACTHKKAVLSGKLQNKMNFISFFTTFKRLFWKKSCTFGFFVVILHAKL